MPAATSFFTCPPPWAPATTPLPTAPSPCRAWPSTRASTTSRSCLRRSTTASRSTSYPRRNYRWVGYGSSSPKSLGIHGTADPRLVTPARTAARMTNGTPRPLHHLPAGPLSSPRLNAKETLDIEAAFWRAALAARCGRHLRRLRLSGVNSVSSPHLDRGGVAVGNRIAGDFPRSCGWSTTRKRSPRRAERPSGRAPT